MLVVLGATAAGCSRAQARVATIPTPLEVPPPPPRLVEPVLAAETLPVEPVDANAIATSPPTPPPPPEPSRAESTRSPEPAPAEALATTPAPTAPGTTLQTLPAERELQVQRSVRASLDGALATLNRVNYQRLGADARVNYDQARRFIAQAEEALRTRNYVFAATVADKAATLAAQLAGR
jgi:hypothetical protein